MLIHTHCPRGKA